MFPSEERGVCHNSCLAWLEAFSLWARSSCVTFSQSSHTRTHKHDHYQPKSPAPQRFYPLLLLRYKKHHNSGAIVCTSSLSFL
mmetsp:Transcript_11674/g.43902  ORF Transcript_11674/g.43902 Transcript_11674/m.43902 type:complete len:83 (-) Transcript_11674:1898-2146(-)